MRLITCAERLRNLVEEDRFGPLRNLYDRPSSSSMAVICSGLSGPCAIVPAVSSTCSTVQEPGIGIACGLRARIHRSAPRT
jgi:hypothetical protein